MIFGSSGRANECRGRRNVRGRQRDDWTLLANRSGPSAATWRPLLCLKQCRAGARGSVPSARSLLFFRTHCRQKLSLSAEKNHLGGAAAGPPQGVSASFILFVPESHFVSEGSASQIKDPLLSDREGGMG